MQFPGNVTRWVTLFLFISLIPTIAGQFEICYQQRHSEQCYIGSFDPPLLSLPENICPISNCDSSNDCQSCSECSVTNWVTFAQYRNKLYNPSHVLSKPFNRPGNDTAYDCTRSQDAYSRKPCDCPPHGICSGDDAFCDRFSCNDSAKCFCYTKSLEIGSYVSISQDFGFDAPSFVSYKACIFNAPPSPSRQARHLLGIESAEFTNDNVNIQFQNPVFTFSKPGTFIARKDGLELVSSIKPKILQFTVPNDFRYSEGSLTFTFVTSTGALLTGTVHIPSSTHCSRINCMFCMAMIHNFSCLPSTLQYISYSLLAFVTGITLIYLRAVFRSLYSICHIFVWIFVSTYRVIRICFRFSLRLGAVTGTSSRAQITRTMQTLTEFANNQPRIPTPVTNLPSLSQKTTIKYSIVILLILLPIVFSSSAHENCNNINVISSSISACETLPSGSETCAISGQAQVTLPTIGSSTCLFFTDDSSHTVYFVRLSFSDLLCQWTTIHQYYTYPVSIHVSSTLICPNFDYCSWGSQCTPDRSHFPGITKEAKSWPGLSACKSIPAKTRFCGVIHYDPCLHYRWYLIPQYNTTYRVDRITGHTCRPSITLSEAIQNKLINTTVVDQVVTNSGIQVNVLGTFDQPITLPSPFLVKNIHTHKDAHIESASPRSQPTPGQLGDIQATDPLSTNFIFNPLMVHCNNYETTINCHIPHSYINVLQKQKPNILPRAVHNHHFYLNPDGTLESTLLQSAPVVVHLRFKNMRVSVHHTKICPQIISVTSVTGCHSCQLAAKIILRAKSLCSSGPASVSFNDIPLSTRSVYLSTDESDVTIHIVTSSACHEDRICLFYNELRSCEPISFCLDDPAISLTQRNISSAQSIALLHSAGIFDQLLASSQSFGTTIKNGLYLFLGCLAIIFFFSLVITLLKR